MHLSVCVRVGVCKTVRVFACLRVGACVRVGVCNTAHRMVFQLLHEEGIFVEGSAGLNVCGVRIIFSFFFIKEKKTVFLSFSHSVSCSLACIFSSSHSRSSRFFFGFPSDQYRQFPLQKKIYQFVPLSTDTASDADQDDRSPVRFVTLLPLSLCLAQRRPRH